jgi:hypothetical protein
MFYCPRLDFAFIRLFPVFGFQIITETSSLEDLPCLERDKHLSDASTLTGFRRIATTFGRQQMERLNKYCGHSATWRIGGDKPVTNLFIERKPATARQIFQ